MGSHLTDQHRSDDRILVPCVHPLEVAVAFFVSEDKRSFAGFFVMPYDLRDKFETRQDVVKLYSEPAADLCRHLACHDGLYRVSVIRKSVLLLQ